MNNMLQISAVILRQFPEEAEIKCSKTTSRPSRCKLTEEQRRPELQCNSVWVLVLVEMRHTTGIGLDAVICVGQYMSVSKACFTVAQHG